LSETHLNFLKVSDSKLHMKKGGGGIREKEIGGKVLRRQMLKITRGRKGNEKTGSCTEKKGKS